MGDLSDGRGEDHGALLARDGVEAPAAGGVAARDPSRREPAATEATVRRDRLDGVCRA